MTPPRLRLGMVGGGHGAFIGAVHRIAARLDDQYDLVAGAFSSDRDRALSSAADLHIAPDRAYGDFGEMARTESARADGVQVVAVVTPNHLHHAVASVFLERGIHVICDKPMTTTLEDARHLVQRVESGAALLAVTYNYTGYPMVRQAREMVAAGEIGPVRVLQVEYAQDWLSTRLEDTGQKQASWRTDPARSGPAGCLGDIGTHAFNLAEFVTGLRCTTLAADLATFVPGRRLDDNAHLLLRFDGGAQGMMWASQIAPGNDNALRLRVYGEKAGLEWSQESPNQLRFSRLGEAPRQIVRGGAGRSEASAVATRIPAGHPEGYLEAFAQLYREFAEDVRAGARNPRSLVPGARDGLRGIAFIAAALDSARRDGAWVAVTT